MTKLISLLITLITLLFINECSQSPSKQWRHFVDRLNSFRRHQVTVLKASNMQKIYWDNKYLGLAHQKLADPDELYTIRNDRKSTFWVFSTAQNAALRVENYFDNLTKIGAHLEDVINEKTLNAPFNLAINHNTIRVGCADRLIMPKIYVVLCVFGPSPLLINHPLYSRGASCSECPLKTGCQDNLCDEMIGESVPPLEELLGIQMSQKAQILTLSVMAVGGMSLIVIGFFIFLYI